MRKETSRYTWVGDCGASYHPTNEAVDIYNLRHPRQIDTSRSVTAGKVICIGKIDVLFQGANNAPGLTFTFLVLFEGRIDGKKYRPRGKNEGKKVDPT